MLKRSGLILRDRLSLERRGQVWRKSVKHELSFEPFTVYSTGHYGHNGVGIVVEQLPSPEKMAIEVRAVQHFLFFICTLIFIRHVLCV